MLQNLKFKDFEMKGPAIFREGVPESKWGYLSPQNLIGVEKGINKIFGGEVCFGSSPRHTSLYILLIPNPI